MAGPASDPAAPGGLWGEICLRPRRPIIMPFTYCSTVIGEAVANEVVADGDPRAGR
jgi:hypothetical protein